MANFNNKVIYQIYPLSYNDSNEDGIGDLKGIEKKLDYLKELGVDYIWLSPVYPSPMKDNGYDVADYFNIDPRFGTLKDFDGLIKAASKRKISIMMDLILNHTSDQNEWFQKSIKREGQYTDYYVWRDKPQKGFTSDFADSPWTFNEERSQYYLHQFAKEQPDLNWENTLIHDEVTKIINFWLKKGVKGFRFDVIDMIGKEVDLGKKFNIPRTYSIMKKIGNASWLKKDILTVAEAWSTNRKSILKYFRRKDGVFSMGFNAWYMFAGWNESRWDSQPVKGLEFQKYKEWFFKTNKRLSKACTLPLFFENHDFSRSVSRLFDKDGFEWEKAKAIATVHYGLTGTMYIYQGQEIATTNAQFSNLEDFNDVETRKFIRNATGTKENILYRANTGTRDNARTVMQWNNETNFGFSKTSPWIALTKKDKRENVEYQLKDKDSPLNFYKDLIKFKKDNHEFFEKSKVIPIEVKDLRIFAYKRVYKNREIIFIANWSPFPYRKEYGEYNKILGTYTSGHLGPYQCLIGEKEVKKGKGWF